jgi:kinesin family protein 2/24
MISRSQALCCRVSDTRISFTCLLITSIVEKGAIKPVSKKEQQIDTMNAE